MGLVLSLNEESVAALRYWADSIGFAANSIGDETNKLMDAFFCNKDNLGVHRNVFEQMFCHILKFQAEGYEPMLCLQKMLNTTADSIENYLYGTSDGDDGNTVPQRIRKLCRQNNYRGKV